VTVDVCVVTLMKLVQKAPPVLALRAATTLTTAVFVQKPKDQKLYWQIFGTESPVFEKNRICSDNGRNKAQNRPEMKHGRKSVLICWRNRVAASWVMLNQVG
jgi:hypothetical protein